MANYNWPINPTTVNSGPIQIEVNGIPQTIDPVLGVFMPSQIYDDTGTLINPATEETSQAILAALGGVTDGGTYVNSIRLDYSSTPVTTGAWVELIASVGATPITEITLFDGGGFAMELGFGAAAAEARALLIPPGGFNGKFTFDIPATTRLSIRAVGSATVNAGEIDINLFA